MVGFFESSPLTMLVDMFMEIVIAITFIVGIATVQFSEALRVLDAASNLIAEELHT